MEVSKESFRQILNNEIENLNNDLRLFWVLRHHHDLQIPIIKVLRKLKALKELLKFHRQRKCVNCGCTLN